MRSTFSSRCKILSKSLTNKENSFASTFRFMSLQFWQNDCLLLFAILFVISCQLARFWQWLAKLHELSKFARLVKMVARKICMRLQRILLANTHCHLKQMHIYLGKNRHCAIEMSFLAQFLDSLPIDCSQNGLKSIAQIIFVLSF